MSAIDSKNSTLNECIKIFSEFKESPILRKTALKFRENETLLERDYEHEIKELKEETGFYREEAKRVRRKLIFPSITKKPDNYVNDINLASSLGKLTCVQYLVEKLHVDAEKKMVMVILL